MNASNFIEHCSFKWHLEHAPEVRLVHYKNSVHVVWFRRKGQYFGRSQYRSRCLPVYSQECNEVLIAQGPEKRAAKEGGITGKWNNATHTRTVNYRAVAKGVPRNESFCNKLYITPTNIAMIYNRHEGFQSNPYVYVRICVLSFIYMWNCLSKFRYTIM